MAKSRNSRARTAPRGGAERARLPQFGREASLRPESFDAESNTIEIVWTTGASVRRFDWWDGTEYDEVLSVDPEAIRLDRLNRGAPFLDTHCSHGLDNVIGSVVPGSASVEEGRGTATILLSKAAGVADTVQKIREGVIRNISVGYWIHKVVKTEGDDGTVARWDVVDWEPLEVSAVPIPADAGSQIRSEQGEAGEPRLRSCLFVTRKPAAGPKPKAGKETSMATRTPKTPTKASPKPAGRRAGPSPEAIEAERLRLAAAARAAEDEDDTPEDDEAERDEDQDEAREGDDAEGDDQRDDDAEDGDDEGDGDEEAERAAPAPAKRAKVTPLDVRRAAEEAVRKDRERGARIRELAGQFGLPKLGERHVNEGTSFRAFKDVVLKRLQERQAKRGDATFAAVPAPGMDDGLRQASAPASRRAFDKGAAEARALLGLK